MYLINICLKELSGLPVVRQKSTHELSLMLAPPRKLLLAMVPQVAPHHSCSEMRPSSSSRHQMAPHIDQATRTSMASVHEAAVVSMDSAEIDRGHKTYSFYFNYLFILKTILFGIFLNFYLQFYIIIIMQIIFCK